MSTLDFNKRASLNVTINISGSGQFDPTGSYAKIQWDLSGAVTAYDSESNLTLKEWLCGVPYNSLGKVYTSFGAKSSNGGTSGAIDVGVLPYRALPENVIGKPLGTWEVNTSPVLSSFGHVDGEVSSGGYYIVAQPKDAKIDDPILVNPPIDRVLRVYPNDYVFLTGKNESARWNVAPQRRQPKPDRTFLWQPNSNPVLKSGGLVDGKLTKPGTIMLPTSNFVIENPQNYIDGISYIYKNYGLLFDGQIWKRLIGNPFVYVASPLNPEDPPSAPEYRNLEVFFSSDQLYARLFEYDQASKPFVTTNKTIDDSSPVVLTFTPEEGEPYKVDLFFRWFDAIGADNGIIPRAVLYDFGDAWSNYHKANANWLKSRKVFELTGAGFILKSNTGAEQETQIILGCNVFEDGNVTTITEKITNFDGEVLTNSFTVSLQIDASMT